MVAKLQKTAGDLESKLAASHSHASACQAELEHAHEELAQAREHGGVGSDAREQPGAVGWVAGFDIGQMVAEDAAGARVPSQTLDIEEARLMVCNVSLPPFPPLLVCSVQSNNLTDSAKQMLKSAAGSHVKLHL